MKLSRGGVPAVCYYLIAQLLRTASTQKTYHYGVSGEHERLNEPESTRLSRFQSTSVSLSPLEDTLRIRQILKKLEDPGGRDFRRKSSSRRLHGVINDFKYEKPVVLSGGLSNDNKTKIRRSQSKKKERSPQVNAYELELARRIEDDQLQFVEDERNPLKYVVENGLLFRKSRFSPLARVEIPEIVKPQKMRNIDGKRRRRKPNSSSGSLFRKLRLKLPSDDSEAVLRTNVFRGNINRQIPAIPLPSPFSAAYSKAPFAMAREEHGKCYTNRFGYRCCDEALEALILKSYEKLHRKSLNLDENLSRIASTLRRDTRQVFAKNFEAIVSTTNFGTSVPSDFSCKVELGLNRFVAQVFVPELSFDAEATVRRRRIPYHELSREDLSDSADLVVSRNGIIVSQVLR